GRTGPTGPTGATGPTGPTGATGPAGNQNNNHQGSSLVTSSALTQQNVIGASGPTGPTGGSADPTAEPITPENVLGRLEAAFLQRAGLSTDPVAGVHPGLGSIVADLAKTDLVNVGGVGQLIKEAKSQAGLTKLDDKTDASGTAL